MDDDEIQTIGVRKNILKEAEGIHYECFLKHWQMLEVLVSFCKDHPNEFNTWKKNKFEKIKKKWEKKTKKLKK